MATPPDTDNGRVTLALLGQKLDAVADKLDIMCAQMRTFENGLHGHDIRLGDIAGQLATQCQRLDGRVDHATGEAHQEATTLAGDIERIEDRQKAWQAGQSTLTIIAASIAAWIGMRS